MSFEALEKIGTPECRAFAARIFASHSGVDQFLKTSYIRWARDRGHAYANTRLRKIDQALKAGGEFSTSMDDQAICDLASVRAIQCKGLYSHYAAKEDLLNTGWRLFEFCEAVGVEFPVGNTENDRGCYKVLCPKVLRAANRVSDHRWWRRQLRVIYGRNTESVLRSLGYVRKGKSAYVSNWAFARWKAAQARNKKTMSGMEAVNEEGDIVLMENCIEKSVANPENRRNELMVRMRGYEEIAEGMAYMGLFFTLTCPSKYHAQLECGGINPKFNGATPVEAMTYLNGVWARIRAAWARNDIKLFGFRVAEPHHDGTPHFHLLLFCDPAVCDTACKLFSEHALAEDGDELGADESRWDVKKIDPAQGTAAGYIAKYVSKNLDGFQVGVDEEGECLADEGAMRARAWASLWGIRQFQQIGSVSVTVWRELRRRRDPLTEGDPQEIEALRSAADRGDWREFVELMGGATVSRKDQLLRPFYHEDDNQPTHYGEALRRLIGVWLQPVARALGRRLLVTRDHVWKIRQRDSVAGKVAAQPPPLDLCQ
ncbi:bacteriophage replication gene A protein [Teredinibacter turnerae T7901]|uniref:Bacteriophage replication gene A protein n=1 Tax=Teredinibacter turnerae (strain ATCC 39867 / T7901) TaxID=377629 RepID=C6AR01_TERTT|nr:replication endonuclease [Teredinibacter turnerae]ACS93543.1 bacteriophage replication gene A protein [Teredinibacter turnerae T7901]